MGEPVEQVNRPLELSQGRPEVPADQRGLATGSPEEASDARIGRGRRCDQSQAVLDPVDLGDERVALREEHQRRRPHLAEAVIVMGVLGSFVAVGYMIGMFIFGWSLP
jgi:hypothetical protein